MKKLVLFLILTVVGASSSFCQLRVVNNFGQDLNVENGGQTILIPNKGIGIFDTRVRTAMLSCWTTDNIVKFVISREVSRSGLVKISPSDGEDVVTKTTPVIKIAAVPEVVSSTEKQSNVQSLASILKGTTQTEATYNQPAVSSSTYSSVTTNQPAVSSSTYSSVTTMVNQSTVVKEPITIEYFGTFTLKIISSEGQGIELLGLNDSIDNSSPRTCVINARKNSDLVIGFVLKNDSKQFIWPYGEIHKHIGDSNTVEITDSDIETLAFYETAKVKLKMSAEGYKILLSSNNGRAVLKYQDISESIDLPIGQSYLQVAYKDPKGIFYPKAFLLVTTSEKGGNIIITAEDLTKSIKVNNW